jgi:cytoskeletal protein CcmA (bactofilin family)
MAMFDKRSPANPLNKTQPPPAERVPQPMAPPAPPPQFLRETEVRTSIGADAVINGKLSFNTPTRVEGKLKGELRCTQLLIIGATAVVEGSVRADELRIEGIVRGDVINTRKVEVCAKGQLRGKVIANRLIVRDGGLFDADCNVGPDVRFVVEEREPEPELDAAN